MDAPFAQMMYRSLEFSMLKIGSHAPDFTITLGSREEFTLSDYRGRNIVIFFYIRAHTHG